MIGIGLDSPGIVRGGHEWCERVGAVQGVSGLGLDIFRLVWGSGSVWEGSGLDEDGHEVVNSVCVGSRIVMVSEDRSWIGQS